MWAVRAPIVIAFALASGCGDAGCGEAAREPAVRRADAGSAATTPEAVASEDPLLARARASIRGGRIDPQVAAELRASTDPAHARAARLLAAFDGDPIDRTGTAPAADQDPEPVVPPPVVPPAELDPEDTSAAADDAPPGTIATRSPPSPGPSAAEPPPRPKKARAELSALSLATTDDGATLTIKAPGGVTVGVANQPSSGIVRLVIEGASATPKVTGARPKVTGARVTGVRKGQDTVQITLQLDPGWRLAGVKSFSGGARVRLVAP